MMKASLLDALRVDVSYLRERRASGADMLLTLLSNRGTQAIFLYRVAHALRRRRVRLLPGILTRIAQVAYAIDIDPDAVIEPGAVIFHGFGIVVGHRARIGRGVVLYQGVTLGFRASGRIPSSTEDGMPVLGQDVIVGAGAKLLGPITVGDGAVIGANAVVLTSVPPHHVAVGVPARVLPQDRREPVGPPLDTATFLSARAAAGRKGTSA